MTNIGNIQQNNLLPFLLGNTSDSEKERLSIMISSEVLNNIIEFNIIQEVLDNSNKEDLNLKALLIDSRKKNQKKTNISGTINDLLDYIFENKCLQIQKKYDVFDFNLLQVKTRSLIRAYIVDSLYGKYFIAYKDILEESEEYINHLLSPIKKIKESPEDPDKSEEILLSLTYFDPNVCKFIIGAIHNDLPGLTYDEIETDVRDVFSKKIEIKNKLMDLTK